jgi:hypothetical protein
MTPEKRSASERLKEMDITGKALEGTDTEEDT